MSEEAKEVIAMDPRDAATLQIVKDLATLTEAVKALNDRVNRDAGYTQESIKRHRERVDKLERTQTRLMVIVALMSTGGGVVGNLLVKMLGA